MTLGFSGPRNRRSAKLDRRRISPALAREGIIGAQHPLVSSTGLRVLASGGNAVDAAVAAALVGTVVMPGRCGLGGDLFAVVSRAGSPGLVQHGERLAFHGSGIAPRGASLDYMIEHGETERRRTACHAPTGSELAVGAGIHRRLFCAARGMIRQPAVRRARRPGDWVRGGWVSHLSSRGREIEAAAALLQRLPFERRGFLPNGDVPSLRPRSCVKPTSGQRSNSSPAGDGSLLSGRAAATSIATFCARTAGRWERRHFADHQTVVAPALATTYRDYTIYRDWPADAGICRARGTRYLRSDVDCGSLGLGSAPAVHTQVGRCAWPSPTAALTPLTRRSSRRPYRPSPVQAVGCRSLCNIDPPMAPVVDHPGHRARRYDLSLRRRRRRADDLVDLLVSGIFGSGVSPATPVSCSTIGPAIASSWTRSPNVYAPGKRTMHTLNCYLIADREGTPGSCRWHSRRRQSAPVERANDHGSHRR